MSTNVGELGPLLKRVGIVRTDMECHSCREQGLKDRFLARINFNIDGNHEIECPRCGHIHYRVVQNGRVTEERYNSSYATHKVERRDVWKSETVPIVSSTTAAFIRDRWLSRDD